MVLLILLILAVLLFTGFGFAIHLLWWLAIAALVILAIMAVSGHLL